MSLIRPAARVFVRRWAETALAALILALGLWWGLAGLGIVRLLGAVLALTGAALVWAAIQRARFQRAGDGPGQVELIEREIRYFGPRGGGFAALDTLTALSLSADAGFWLLETDQGTILAIPRAAAGAEALFDAFSSLDGLAIDHLLRISAQGAAPRARLIWRRPHRPLLT